MKKRISILGSTGSIGITSLKIIDKRKSFFHINILSANKNYNLIKQQIKKYKPKIFIINDQKIFKKVHEKFKGKKIKILNSFKLKDLKIKNDITISAIPGLNGLEPTLTLMSMSKKVLLANKESIICGWNLLKKKAFKNKTQIVPVDSEHFSIFKLLKIYNIEEIEKIFLTASGGPFLNSKVNKLKYVKPKEALNHPKWKMGKKITIDSSTLMNKILELIEAQKLFNIPYSKLDIIIHPNSLVHAIVKLKNGLSHFIYHDTSMTIPLANAIFDNSFDIKNFFNVKNKRKIFENLYFKKVNPKIFPIIKIKKRLPEYPATPIIINAANEILVDQFLQKNIPFLMISKTIMTILNNRNYKKYAIRNPKNINQIKKIDEWAKKYTLIKCKKF